MSVQLHKSGILQASTNENLIWNPTWQIESGTIPKYWRAWGSPTIRETVVNNGRIWLHVKTTDYFQGWQAQETDRGTTNEVTAGEKVTLSFWAYSTTSHSEAPVGIHWRGNNAIISQNWFTVNLSLEPDFFHYTYTVPANVTSFNIMVGTNNRNGVENWISEVKLEKGSDYTAFDSFHERSTPPSWKLYPAEWSQRSLSNSNTDWRWSP